MANEVKIRIKIDDNGDLKVIAKEAKGAADATDKLAKSTDRASKSNSRYHKGAKGVAGLTNNSTKAFSKQNSAIQGGGSSSLVGAYATLAANVFALSAAFNFLKRAADVSNLEKSQVSYAQNTGVALSSLTSKLRGASGGMLGFQEAAQASAIGLAKGFSPSQMERIAEGARKASTALGRDFSDSFDRLVRGISKAEPELLDELGITLRLKTATEDYARAINSTAKELTASQRSQAVFNATMRELEANFGSVIARDNPFTLLSKTFEDLVKTGTEIVLPFFTGFANIVSSNALAAVSVFGLLGASLFKMMVPLDGVKERFDNMVGNTAAELEVLDSKLQKVQTSLNDVEGAKRATQSVATKAGPTDSKLLKKAQKGQLTDPKEIGALQKTLKARIAAGDAYTGVLKKQTVQQSKIILAALEHQVRITKSNVARKVSIFRKGYLNIQKSIIQTRKVATRAFGVMGKAASIAGNTIGKAMKWAGYIGIAIMLFEAMKSIASSFYRVSETVLTFIKGPLEKLLKGFNVVITAVNAVIAAYAYFYGMLVDKGRAAVSEVISVFNTLLRGIASSVGGVIDLVIDGLNELISGVLPVINKGLALLGKDTIDPTLFSEPSNKAKEFADNVFQVENSFKDATNKADEWAGKVFQIATFTDTAADSLIGYVQAKEKARIADERSNAVMKESIELSKKMGEDLGTQRAGLSEAKNPASFKASAIQSLGVGGQVNKIAGAASSGILNEEDASKAFDAVKNSMKGLKDISAGMAAILNDSSLSIKETAAALKVYDEAAANAVGGSAAFKDQLAGIDESLEKFDLSEMSGKLRALGAEAERAAGGYKTLGETAAASAALAANAPYAELKAKVDELLKTERELQQVKVGLAESTGNAYEMEKLTVDVSIAKNDVATKALAYAEGSKTLTKEKLDLLEQELIVAGLLLNNAEKRKELEESRQENERAGRLGGELFGNAMTASNALTDSEVLTDDTKNSSDKMAAISEMTNPMLENLKSISPEGEFYAAAIEGTMALSESFMTAFEEGGMSAKNMMQMGATAVQALGSIMAAKSKSAVAGVDKEIAAEKKKDGKSKESLAKIAALEKKKDNMKRKAFEQNKKIQMAQTVMATSLAIMTAVQGPPGLPWSAVFGAAAGAMGMAQLAAIAGTSYEGGGSIASAGGDRGGVSVGERKNSVDLASSKGAVGELGYMRGGSGTGNASNFKPAFTGARYRAAGGSVGYMVGEQGPELFMPEVPGNIVPAGETETIQEGTTNLNFSITALDAAGVEEVLSGQRGNIIRMIRETANDAGETFLEGLNENY